VLRNIYFAKFQSLMRYGIILWGGTSETTKVLKLRKRVLRLMTNKYKTESCRTIFKELKILTVICLFIFESLCFFQKCNIYQVKNLNLHEYETRNKDDLHVLQCQTSLYKKSVINMSIRLYNWLQVEIKKLSDYNKFKQTLKLFLLDNPFYSLAEFFLHMSNINKEFYSRRILTICKTLLI
jgi:hypothetical protein